LITVDVYIRQPRWALLPGANPDRLPVLEKLENQLDKQATALARKEAGPLAYLMGEEKARYQLQVNLALKDAAEEKDQTDAAVNKMLRQLVRELAPQGPAAMARRMKDGDPWVRWVAVQVAANQWMPLEQDLIDLLDDPCPPVRAAARLALVRLSRGNDFGPFAAEPTPAQRRQAQEDWQHWLDLQQAVQGSETPHK
jgi:hypothetical protein